jgi:type I restriction enzyme S subunit
VPNETADADFYYYLFSMIAPEFKRLGSGSTFDEISGRLLAAVVVPRPSVEEQQAIAHALDAADDAIDHSERLLAKLTMIRTGLLAAVLHSGIDEDGNLRECSSGAAGFRDSPFGRIPETWRALKLVEVTERVTDGTHQAVKTQADGDGSVPFLYVSCVRDGAIKWDDAARISAETFSEIARGREPKRGMVLYTAVGSYGHAATVDTDRRFAFQRHIACIYPRLTEMTSAFLANWLNSSWARKHADRVALGNAQKTVTLGELGAFPIPVPPVDEQARINEVIRRADARIEAEKNEVAKLKALKRGLSADLLSGRVRFVRMVREGGGVLA